MPTTVTPEAQLAVIANSAVTPSRPDPYPTLVGTATTGEPVSPPTTLASAPFHAGHDHHGRGLLQGCDVTEDPVDAGHPGIVDAPGDHSVRFQDDRALLGHGQIGGAGGDDHDGVAIDRWSQTGRYTNVAPAADSAEPCTVNPGWAAVTAAICAVSARETITGPTPSSPPSSSATIPTTWSADLPGAYTASGRP